MAKKSKLAKIGAGIAAAYLASKMGDSGSAAKTVTDTADLGSEQKNVSALISGDSANTSGAVKSPTVKKAVARKVMKPGASIDVSKVRNFGFGSMGFQSGGAVVTKGQGKSMRPKKTILLT